ncbi:MAG TPA: hypothetical protein VFM77_05545 [Terriglobales bacterium]|nr:hypothetical protein [Terriglobales bacterium]
MAFEQATIKVEKEKEFGELKSAIVTAFSAENVLKFLKRVSSAGVRIRDFDPIVAKGVFEQIDGALAKGQRAQALYSSLPVTDQAQMKEFYLFKIEEVSPELRAKFQKIYQYY